MPEDGPPEGLLIAPTLGAPHGFETRNGNVENGLPALLRVQQVHGNEVHIIAEDTPLGPYCAPEPAGRPPGDALITRRRDVGIGVATADCVPVLIHEPHKEIVAAVHAGWRGVAAEIVPATIAALAEMGGAPERSKAAIGPCVGASVYRVGPDVITQFGAVGLPDDIFRDHRVDAEGRDTALCDLGRAVALQLRNAGLEPAAVWLAGRCTATEVREFHSYRRDGEAAGRMTSAIALAG